MSTALGDGVVSLRPLDEKDVGPIVDACLAAPDIGHWVMRSESIDEPGVRKWIERREQGERDGEQITRAIVHVDRHAFLGAVWLGRFDREARRAELAYWTAMHARERGFATAAVRLMTRFALEELALLRVEILAATQNRPSQRVAEKAGFTKEGVLRSYRNIAGEQTDLVIYSKLALDP